MSYLDDILFDLAKEKQNVDYLDYIMLELAENGEAYFTSDYDYSIEDVRDAAREDGVQVRIKELKPNSYAITLRKVGLGH